MAELETLTLRAKRGEGMLALIICLVVVGLGVVVLVGGETTAGWVIIGLSGAVAAALALKAAFAKRIRLQLDAEGFTQSLLLRERRTLWTEVDAFGTHEIRGAAFLGWRVVDGAPGRRSDAERRFASGLDYTFPSTYGLSPDALLALLERYRRAATAGVRV